MEKEQLPKEYTDVEQWALLLLDRIGTLRAAYQDPEYRRYFNVSEEPEWYADWVDEWMDAHVEETGCPGGSIDSFNDSDYLYCGYCGDEL